MGAPGGVSGGTAAAVERDLAQYYEQEASTRAERDIDPRRAAARDRFIRGLPSGSAVLEVGIGPGRDAAAFVGAGLHVCGVDLALAHGRFAAQTGAAPAVASVRALPFAAASFDALWSMSTLMHVPNAAIAAALTDVRRVLRPGAPAAIGVWGGPNVESRHDDDAFDPPRLFSRRTDQRWRDLLSILGDVEEFAHWNDLRGGAEHWYQWAVVRRSPERR
jgi:SAM-dependent methyltransferase